MKFMLLFLLLVFVPLPAFAGFQNNFQSLEVTDQPFVNPQHSNPIALSPEIGPAPPEAFGKVQRWRGLRGANLKEVFEAWAEDAGVKLIWAAPAQMALPSSLNQVTSFSDIIAEALSQFENMSARPVARLYTGGDTPTLVVTLEGAGL